MIGVNKVVISGSIVGTPTFGSTSNGTACCSFKVETSRRSSRSGDLITTYTKINVYGDLVDLCEKYGYDNSYCVIEGELMNRYVQKDDKSRADLDTKQEARFELTEIRARDVVFPPEAQNA